MTAVQRSNIVPAAHIRAIFRDTIRLHSYEFGTHHPGPRRSFTRTIDDLGITITLRGEGLGHGPYAEYQGPFGLWYANINPGGVGKPWCVDAPRESL